MLADGRPVRASDILILVRERSSLMEAIVRALKDCNVPVAGADRLDLLSHITAQDLMALGRFVILPEDDLNLAALLKSPLLARDDGQRFNDDDDIFSLAHGRGTASLWQRFTGAVASGAPWSKALDRLQGWRADAARHGVFRFFANVLSRDNGRADFINAIGHEAGEPVDAFLQQCLEYERENLTSMAGFLAWLEDAAANLKRDMEQGAGEVRVMTVHGAKGLEAPIVFLPDTCSKPNGRKTSKVLVDEGAGELPVWHIKSDFEVDYTAELKQAEQDAMQQEYNRLLYVAMTRARDRLYVCGFLKSRKKDDWEHRHREGRHLVSRDPFRTGGQRPGYGCRATDRRTESLAVRVRLHNAAGQGYRNRARQLPMSRWTAGPLIPFHPSTGPNAGLHRRSWAAPPMTMTMTAGRARSPCRRLLLRRTGASGAARWFIGCCSPCPSCRRTPVKMQPGATCRARGWWATS
jgi:ATP-dependent exoDNAse (exonuclease V) beta subunit